MMEISKLSKQSGRIRQKTLKRDLPSLADKIQVYIRVTPGSGLSTESISATTQALWLWNVIHIVQGKERLLW